MATRRIDTRPRNRPDVAAGVTGAHIGMKGNLIGGYTAGGTPFGTKLRENQIGGVPRKGIPEKAAKKADPVQAGAPAQPGRAKMFKGGGAVNEPANKDLAGGAAAKHGGAGMDRKVDLDPKLGGAGINPKLGPPASLLELIKAANALGGKPDQKPMEATPDTTPDTDQKPMEATPDTTPDTDPNRAGGHGGGDPNAQLGGLDRLSPLNATATGETSRTGARDREKGAQRGLPSQPSAPTGETKVASAAKMGAQSANIRAREAEAQTTILDQKAHSRKLRQPPRSALSKRKAPRRTTTTFI